MQIQKLYKEHGIAFITGEDNIRGSRDGWVNTACPYCTGNPGYHLGWNEDSHYFVCWRCGGGKKTIKTFSDILRLPEDETRSILRKYKGTTLIRKKKTPKIKLDNFRLPKPMLKTVTKPYLDYLYYGRKSGFDAEKIVAKYKLQATGINSLLDNVNYKRRLLIPIFWNSEIVTFQGRDITDKHPMKYLACPEDRERISIKKILYGRQDRWGDVGICVEGATDVWRLGDCSFAMLGIKHKPAQVRLVAKQFKRVFILFDPEPIAQRQAKRLQSQLRFRGVETYVIPIETDPADMPQAEADSLVRDLKTWKIK